MGSPWKEETVRLGVDKAIFSAGLKLSSLFVQKCIKMCEKKSKEDYCFNYERNNAYIFEQCYSNITDMNAFSKTNKPECFKFLYAVKMWNRQSFFLEL